MTTLQAFSLIHRWLHHDPPKPKPPDLPEHPPPLVTKHQSCTGYQTGTGAILHQQQKLLDQLYDQLNLPEPFKKLQHPRKQARRLKVYKG